MDLIYKQIVANKQKAIAGFFIAAAIAYFSKHGIDIEALTVAEAIELVVYGVIAYLGVYFKRNK